MSANRPKLSVVTERRVPYPAWTSIAAEVRRTAGPEQRIGTSQGRQWQDLLAEDGAEIGTGRRKPS